MDLKLRHPLIRFWNAYRWARHWGGCGGWYSVKYAWMMARMRFPHSASPESGKP